MSFTNSYSEFIWGKKYKAEFDKSIEDTWRRVAHTLASGKKEESEFYSLLEDFKFLPAGRILTSIGSGRKATAFNCFVMDTIDDSMPDIFRVLLKKKLTHFGIFLITLLVFCLCKWGIQPVCFPRFCYYGFRQANGWKGESLPRFLPIRKLRKK